MRFLNFLLIALSSSFLLFFMSCSQNEAFEVKDFTAINNYESGDNLIKTISLDYSDAFKDGFVIPSIKQSPDGFFEASFQIRNNGKSEKQFLYKIYYQNETYSFPDNHPLAHENFYGSWEDVQKTFELTPVIHPDKKFHTVSTKYRIVGNPRDEKRFYGSEIFGRHTEEELSGMMNYIKDDSSWYALIKQKTLANKNTVDQQLSIDAVFALDQHKAEIITNNRWKRNPRVGEYKFLLVVVEDSMQLSKLPSYIQNVGLLDSVGMNFVNPFSYFASNKENYNTFFSLDKLKVKAQPDFQPGMYIKEYDFTRGEYDDSYMDFWCNSSDENLFHAHFEQFVSHFVPSYKFRNIPLVEDVHGGHYSKEDYNNNLNKTHQFISSNIEVPACPCKGLKVNEDKNSLELINPGTMAGEWRKENIGIISRHGFTYGTYRAKIKFPSLLNKHDVWNGLTNAFWLIYQQGSWNTRRNCSSQGGYVPKSYDGGELIRNITDSYSEIDIEIVKASRNWPLSSYGGDASKKPIDPISDSNKVMVTYTNWDLACPDPKKFDWGVFDIVYNNNRYQLHRWDDLYQAVTGKTAVLNDELFDDYYWYEIEWKPEEIIWRIGPDKDKMYEIGYMNAAVTSIPNNQMLMIVTQEWHLENWWPEAPFNQNFIPYPAKNIIGEVVEFEIE